MLSSLSIVYPRVILSWDEASRERLLWTSMDKSPSRKVGELDVRGSHFYLALYWAQALAEQTADVQMAARFAPLAERLAAEEATIMAELNEVQGQPMDIGGYYAPDPVRAAAAMRPSPAFNAALASLG